ncbi:MAG: hypothetical protein WDZ69_02690 [Candidatus Pacearchaeota archaeon]
MLKRFLEEAVNIAVGRQAEEIVKLLHTKKHVNEFLLAKKLDLTINQTRNVLYKISDQGLVSSIRKKDKKKGWYTYFWKIEVLKSLEFLKSNLLRRKYQFEKQVNSRETKRFYVCTRCNIELTEENALLQDFICNECGSIFTLKDNTKVVKEMKKNLDRINNDLELIEEEIVKERDKSDKSKARDLRKEEKKKKIKRAEGRAKRKKEREKIKKESVSGKKKTSKKTIRKAAKKKTSKKKVVKKKTKIKNPVKKKTAKKKVTKKAPKKKVSRNVSKRKNVKGILGRAVRRKVKKSGKSK